MKKIFLLMAALASTVLAMAQTTQSGTIVEYVGQKPKKAMAGVEVIAKGANSTTSDKTGAYTLRFNNAHDGDALNILNTVWKNDKYELFVKDRVIGRAISSKVPLQIILVKSSFLKKQKDDETKKMTAKYIKERDDALAIADDAKKHEKITQERYQIMIDSIKNDYYQKMHDLDEFLEQFIHCDLSQMDEGTSRVLKLMDEGKIKEAKQAFEQLKIADKNRQEAENRKQYQRMVEEGEKGIAKSDSAQASLFENVKIYVNKLKLEGGKENFDEAGRVLKEFALSDTTNVDAVWEYAKFALEQDDFNEAEQFFLMVYRFHNAYCEAHPNADRDAISHIMHNLGAVYYEMYHLELSEKYYLAALAEKEKLFEQNPDKYMADLSNTLNNLGNLYDEMDQYQKAEKYYLRTLALDEQIYEKEHDEFSLLELSSIQKNLGGLYGNMRLYDKAEEYMLKSMANRNQLMLIDSTKYRSPWANLMSSLGGLYLYVDSYSKSEEYYLKALANFEVLMKQNPDAHMFNLARNQANIGQLYLYMDSPSKSEEYLLKALSTFEQLSKRHANAYKKALSTLSNTLGVLYEKNQSYDKAEMYYRKSLDYAAQLYQQNPDAYREDYASSFGNLGIFYARTRSYDKAIEKLLQSLEHKKILFEKDPNTFREDLALSFNNIGAMYCDMDSFDQSEKYLLMAMEHRQILMSQDTNAYISSITTTYFNLGIAYQGKHSYLKSEEYFNKTIANLQLMYKKNPKVTIPKLAETYMLIMYLYDDMNDLENCLKYQMKSKELYTLLCENEPTKYQGKLYALHKELVYIRLQEGKTDLSDVINDMKAIDPENYLATVTKACNSVAYKKAKTGNFAEAIACINKAIELIPEDANYYDTKGEILLMKGDIDEALNMWHKVVEIAPEFANELISKGQSELYKGLKKHGLVE